MRAIGTLVRLRGTLRRDASAGRFGGTLRRDESRFGAAEVQDVSRGGGSWLLFHGIAKRGAMRFPCAVQRLDQVMVERGLCESRTQAQRFIMAGQVRINGHPAAKASDRVRETDGIELLAADRYVSRGGHKLEHGLTEFGVDPTGVTALDIGASTGGFTDCLLQYGAARVFAVDVGQGQLAWKLRQDPRVVVMERTNARHLTPSHFPPDVRGFDLVVMDCSFISLRQVLPPIAPLVRKGGRVVALVKPQFEAGKAEADRGAGVITDPEVHARVLSELEAFVRTEPLGLVWRGVTTSPLLGPAGNREFLALLESPS